MEVEARKNRARAKLVLFTGILFNLSIGVLYSWSTIKKSLMKPVAEGGFGFTSSEAGLPYTVAIVFFAFGLLVGGRIQDKIGPKKVVTAGAVLIGLGLILSGLVGDSIGVWGLAITFGVVTGTGIGCGYGCVSPPALKWFHPTQKGVVSGLIVGGFGLAAVYYAPLTTYLLASLGIKNTFLLLGCVIGVLSISLAQLITNPPKGYIPEPPQNAKKASANKISTVDLTWRDMIKTKEFYMLFIMFAVSSSVGLMIIGNVSKITEIQAPDFITYSAILVSFLAITNTSGRVLGGMLSDKIGRVNTLIFVFLLQAFNMVIFKNYTSVSLLLVGLCLTGFCYGSLLSVFPSLTADRYGLKNYGLNYGVLYISWGLSGVLAPLMADFVYDASKASGNASFTVAYYISSAMMVAIAIIAFFLRKMDNAKK